MSSSALHACTDKGLFENQPDPRSPFRIGSELERCIHNSMDYGMVNVVCRKAPAFNRHLIRFRYCAILVVCLGALSPDVAAAANGTWTNGASGGLWSVA